ncbi:MAG: hypothetical protein CBC05_03080 [Crocinitomicaceae bacterium TMED45]|nr:MAG: hypothetical protein CBC05_03080 [Crocinitomicaceae bacterium TMED45]
MTATSLLSRTLSVAFVVLLLLLLPASLAQRNASKNTKIDVTTIPRVHESIVDNLVFFVHADPNFFTLDDLRHFGGKIKVD